MQIRSSALVTPLFEAQTRKLSRKLRRPAALGVGRELRRANGLLLRRALGGVWNIDTRLLAADLHEAHAGPENTK